MLLGLMGLSNFEKFGPHQESRYCKYVYKCLGNTLTPLRVMHGQRPIDFVLAKICNTNVPP